MAMASLRARGENRKAPKVPRGVAGPVVPHGGIKACDDDNIGDLGVIMEFDKFVEWGFLGIIGSGVGWAALFLSKISQSVSELNGRVAVILEKTGWHEKAIDEHETVLRDHDGRLRKVETRRH